MFGRGVSIVLVAQWIERLVAVQKVAGSIPAKDTNLMKKNLRTWLEIDKKSIAKNFRLFSSLLKKDCQLMGVVKSNAYGHSLLDFAKELQKLGTTWLAVDSIVEGEALRKEGIHTKILVLGHSLPTKIKEAIEGDLSLTVSSLENLTNISKLKFNGKIKIHLKIDTGMHRQGFYLSDLGKVISLLKKNKNKFEVEGVYTHFATAKNPALPKETRQQISEFEKAVAILNKNNFNPLRHCAATSSTLLFPESHFDAVRVGIGLYGLWPSKETRSAMEAKIKLSPTLSWKTIICETKKLKKGDKVGYDLTEGVLKNSTIAILPVGYWHGYPRALSSIGHVSIKGKLAKVLGRVSMDMIVVDITNIKNVRQGDEVELIGKNISTDSFANLTESSHNYAVVTRINPLIKRFFV